jgi:hypothetical protein
MKPLVAGFPLKRQRAIGEARGVQVKPGRDEKAISMKFEVAPESINVGIVFRRPGICTRIMKEESERELIAAKRRTGEIE